MNTTTNDFDFKRDHPELYAQVQERKAAQRSLHLITFLVSITINLGILVTLYNTGADMSSLILVTGWIFFSTPFSVKSLIEWVWK